MKSYFPFLPAFFFLLLVACQPSGPQSSVKYSPVIDSLLRDTVVLQARADSLRQQLLAAPNDSSAIAGLSQLSEFFFGRVSNLIAEEAMGLSEKPANASYAAMAWCARGIAGHRSQQYDTALYFLDRAVELARKNNDAETALRATIWKGDCYRMLYRIDDARALLDSCATVAERSGQPRLQAQALSLAGDIYRYNNADSTALARYDKAVAVAQTCGDSSRIAFCMASAAQVHRKHSETEKAMAALNRGLVAAKAANDLSRAAFLLSTLGDEYRFKGKQPEALARYSEALAYAKKTKEKRRYGIVQNVVTQVYWSQGDLDKAYEANTEALKVFTEIKDASSLSYALSNRGEIFRMRKQLDSALVYYQKSNVVSGEIGETQRMGYAAVAIAEIYHGMERNDSALAWAVRAVAFGKELEEDNLLSDALRLQGLVEMDMGHLAQAKTLAHEALEVAKRSETQTNINGAYELLYLVYKRLNQPQEALRYFETFTREQDSLKGTEQVRKLAAVEYHAKELSLKTEQAQREAKIEAEKKQKEDELARQQVITAAAAIGGLLLLVLLGVAYNAYRNKKQANTIIQQQKQEVEYQKLLVDEKNREVHDSITYAKRLQEAILPEPARIRSRLPASFIYYAPKDIVAGDFYWFEEADGKFFIAAADSTGHGVPGAMISVVCSNALNKAVNELGLRDPGKILDAATKIVLETFARGGNEVSDGMDISLAVIHAATHTVEWAGANRPLWYAHNGELHEIKGDRQPVGRSENRQPFTTHTLEGAGKTIYLFTDGFADQFGGNEGKKLQVKNFRKWLTIHTALEPGEQLHRLEKMFIEWKGNREQVDDVCVIGVRL